MSQTQEVRIARSFIAAAGRGEIDLSEIRDDLSGLSDDTKIESFDVSGDAVSLEGDGRFSGEAILYLSLVFREGDIVVGEELPVSFQGQVDETSGEITFLRPTVDLTPLVGAEIDD